MAADFGLSSLYTRLKDKDLPLEHKLQLLRFTWKSDQVFIPNKEQVLIDLLTGYLLNKKKYQLREDEVAKVWNCLHDVLLTKKAHQANKQGQGLVIKQSICQVILEALSLSASPEVTCSYVHSLIGCCQSLMSSATLSYIFIGRLDQMLSLLGTLCSLLVKHVQDDNTRESLTLLLDETVRAYVKVQKTAPNQKQLLQWGYSKLLPNFLSLWCASQTYDTLSGSTGRLCEVIEQTLFHKDHQEGYAFYLNMKYGERESTSTKKPKLFEQVFAALDTAITDKSLDVNAACLYVPVLLESFIKANCHNSSQSVAHHMLMECCNLIGVKSDSAALCGPADKAVVIKGVNQLLKVIQRWDVYNVSADEKGKQLQFYRHLTGVLLENRCFVPDWYSCFTVLLQLNHQILEPSLTDILLNTWLNDDNKQQSDTQMGKLDELLQELVSTYQKLRQFQKFMIRLLEVLKQCSNTQVIVTPSGFLKRFGEVSQTLPQGMTIDIWKMFVQHLKDNHITGEHTGHFQGVCTLFHQYLLNVKVADYSTTDITVKAVQDLMVIVETEILSPLLQLCKKDKECADTSLLSTLQLCHIWGEVMIMLAQYTRYRAENFTTQPQAGTYSDLNYIHSYLSSKDWMKIHKRIFKSDDKRLIYSWDRLMIQQIRGQLLLTNAKTISMATVFDLPAELSSADLDVTWYPSVYSISEKNFLVAKWHLMVSNMSAVYRCLSDEQCWSIAHFIIQTADRKGNENSELIRLANTTDNLLSSPWMREFPTLQSGIVTAVWKSVHHCFTGKKKSGKKRKSGTMITVLQSVFSVLGDETVAWTEGLTSETASSLEKVAEGVNKLLENQEPLDDRPDLHKILTCLEVLQKLPVENLSSWDQLRCLFGLLSLIATISSCSQTEKTRTSLEGLSQNEASQTQIESTNQNEAVLTSCVQLMMIVLESCGTASIFQLLNVHICLDWLQRLQNLQICRSKLSVFLRVLMLVEMCCSSMVRDYQVLAKLPDVVTELCSSLKRTTASSSEAAMFICSCLLQDISKLLKRAYLDESLKSICSEMFVSMATVVLGGIEVLSTPTHSKFSCHVVKCLSIVMAAHLATEVKGQLMSVLIGSLNGILEWCLESLQEETEIHSRLTALNCLFTIIRRHNHLGDAFTLEKKLAIWNRLVNFLQCLLNHQPSISGQGQSKTHPVVDTSQAKELYQFRDKEMDRSADQEMDVHVSMEETSGCSQHFDTNDSSTTEEHKTSFLDVINFLEEKAEKSPCSAGSGLSLKSSVKIPNLAWHNPNASDRNSEFVLSVSSINAMYKTLVYEDNWERQGSKVILVQVQSVIAAIVMSFDIEDFTKVIQGIVEDVSVKMMLCDVKKLQCSLYIWQRLLKLDLSPEQAQVVVYAAKNLMLNFQSIVQQLSHHENESLLMTVGIPVIRAQEQMLALGKMFLSPQMSVLCLHSCQFLPLDGSTYLPAFHAAFSVLSTFLMNHTEAALKTIPSYLGCAKRLLLSVVQHANQVKVQGDRDMTEKLVDCAHQMERLFSQISTHKVDFNKVALYVVSDYVTAIQRVTLVPAVKRALVPAVYKMLDLCDKHSIAQLHTVLSHGVCEVFKLLYSDYNKYYRYTGKI